MDHSMPPAIANQRLRITGIRNEVPGVKTFFLEPTSSESFKYKAGQFLTFIFDRHGREERRSYSVSSSLAVGDSLAITVKRVENGAHSRWLIDHAKVGDELLSTGAAGLFTLPERVADYPQIFFFAAGIGITPVFSMIKELLAVKAQTRIVLIYSNRAKEAATFQKELLQLQTQYPDQLKIEWLYSDAKNLLRARISKAIIPHILQQYLEIPPEQLLTYICGPEDYRWVLNLLLEEAGVQPVNIRKEIFVPGRMPISALPTDTEPHKVVINLKGKQYELQMQYPETILSAAKKAGIPLSYSCEAGRCASCIVRCESGNVWMAYNEVLTTGDLQKGLTLTCTGYPVGGDVQLTAL